MAITVLSKATKIPTHHIRLEGLGQHSRSESGIIPLVALELESTPYGHIKVKMGTEEAILPADLIVRAIHTLAPPKE